MAIQFDETDDYFTITDDASLTLQDGDWCVGAWTKVDDNSGSVHQYLICNGKGVATNGSFNLHLNETTDKWGFTVQDDDGTHVSVEAAGATGGDGKWRLIVAQRRTADNELQLWFCELGQTASRAGSQADTDVDSINGLDWYIGSYNPVPANRYYGSTACEIFKGDFSLSQEEIEALGAGLPIHALSHTPDMYLEMTESVATLRDLFGSNDASRSSAPTTVEHAPVSAVMRPILVQTIFAAPPAAKTTILATEGIHSVLFGGQVVR